MSELHPDQRPSLLRTAVAAAEIGIAVSALATVAAITMAKPWEQDMPEGQKEYDEAQAKRLAEETKEIQRKQAEDDD